MNTIETCSIFDIEIEKILLDNNIVNWIWGKWWFNFDRFFKDNITVIKEYIPEKWNNLIHNVKRLSIVHDMFYNMWWTKLQFYFANYIFIRDLWKLLNWIWFFKRISILLIVFISLNKYWKKYFNFK